MQHLHFKTINSTQKHLNDLAPRPDDLILVTADEQTEGGGQRSRPWTTFKNALAMSFTFRPSEVVTLTSLELGVLYCRYFKENYEIDLRLKWPNDLLSLKGEKLGGILIEKTHIGPCIVGIGVNLSQKNLTDVKSDYPISGIFEDFEKFDIKTKDLAANIYTYLLNNRLKKSEIIESWNNYCLHLNKKIRFIENDETSEFIFKGIGEMGEAILEDDLGVLHTKFSGSIRI